jgi:hypothetical protein
MAPTLKSVVAPRSAMLPSVVAWIIDTFAAVAASLIWMLASPTAWVRLVLIPAMASVRPAFILP